MFHVYTTHDPKSGTSRQFVKGDRKGILKYDVEENIRHVKNENYRTE